MKVIKINDELWMVRHWGRWDYLLTASAAQTFRLPKIKPTDKRKRSKV